MTAGSNRDSFKIVSNGSGQGKSEDRDFGGEDCPISNFSPAGAAYEKLSLRVSFNIIL